MATLLLKGTPIGNVDGVLFDKDGTLSHSEPLLIDLAERRIRTSIALWRDRRGCSDSDQLASTLQRAFGLQENALSPGGTLAVASRQDNLTSTATVFCLFGCTWPEALGLAQRSFNLVDQDLEHASRPSALLPHAETLLQRLKAFGVRNAVISNDTTSGIQQFLRHHHLSATIEAVWSADDQPRKPDPKAVELLCQQLHLDPNRCALIGDAETDLQMAKQAGIGCVIGFTGGWTLRPELPSADHLLETWSHLRIVANA